jgi:hypothetical protein
MIKLGKRPASRTNMVLNHEQEQSILGIRAAGRLMGKGGAARGWRHGLNSNLVVSTANPVA